VEYYDGSFELLYRPLNAAQKMNDAIEAPPLAVRRAAASVFPPACDSGDFAFVDAPNAG
jgi:hypothetical protein